MFFVGTLKGVGPVNQQTFVYIYLKWATAKLYTTKTPITSAQLLNDRGTEFCGKAESHDYQLYLALNDTEYAKTNVMHPQKRIPLNRRAAI